MQQNTIIKEEEDDVDVLSEDCIDMKFEEVYIPSAFPIGKVEPEVSLVHRCFVHVFPVCVFVQDILNIMSNLEKACSSFNSCEWNIFAVKQKKQQNMYSLIVPSAFLLW